MAPLQPLPSPVPRGAIRPLPGGRREAPPSTFPPLDQDEQDAFESLRVAVKNGRAALMRVVHDGEARAAICIVMEADGMANVYPVALLLDDALFEQVQPPDGAETLDRPDA